MRRSWPRAARTVAAGGLAAGACALVACVLVLGASGAWLAACGLPAGGLAAVDGAAGDDVTGGDDAAGGAEGSSGGGDGGGPGGDAGTTGCATVDASCLSGVPAGWQPVTVGDAGCPSAFTAAVLRTNPRVDDGGCACGACQVVGAYTCAGPSSVTSGDGCGDLPPLLGTVSPDTCTQARSSQHVQAHPPTATGTVACAAPNDAGAGATSDPLTVCYPSCTADFCAAGPHCIVSDGDVTCPGGFTLLAKAGTGADPGCAPCTCDAGPPAACGGTVTVFGDSVCGDSGTASYAVDTCNSYDPGFTSVL